MVLVLETYTITRAFTRLTIVDNATSATQTITVVDTTAPVLMIPGDYTAECSDEHPMDDASATDNCRRFTRSMLLRLQSLALVLVITRSLVRLPLLMTVATQLQRTQTITIVDTTAPVLSNPS